MTRTAIGRTPAQLVEDLQALESVDWATLWRGFIVDDPHQWFIQFGWKLAQIIRSEGFEVRIPTGRSWYVMRQDPHGGITELSQDGLWRSGDQTGDAIQDALARWVQYLDAATSVWGEPDVVTTFDSPDFPKTPRWPERERRQEARNPAKLAMWQPTSGIDAVRELWVNQTSTGSSASVRLGIRAPE